MHGQARLTPTSAAIWWQKNRRPMRLRYEAQRQLIARLLLMGWKACRTSWPR